VADIKICTDELRGTFDRAFARMRASLYSLAKVKASVTKMVGDWQIAPENWLPIIY